MPVRHTFINHNIASVLEHEELVAKVHAKLTAFETETTEIERLWIIHDKNRTANPAAFEIGIALWRTRGQALKDRITEFWTVEESIGYEWRTYSRQQQLHGPDHAIEQENRTLRAVYNELLRRIKDIGFLDYARFKLLRRDVVGNELNEETISFLLD